MRCLGKEEKHPFPFSHWQTNVRTYVLYLRQQQSQCKRCLEDAEACSAGQSVVAAVFHVCPYHACKILFVMEQPKGVSCHAFAASC